MNSKNTISNIVEDDFGGWWFLQASLKWVEDNHSHLLRPFSVALYYYYLFFKIFNLLSNNFFHWYSWLFYYWRLFFFCSSHLEEILGLFLVICTLLSQTTVISRVSQQTGQEVRMVLWVYPLRKKLKSMAWLWGSNFAKHACSIVPHDALIAQFAITVWSDLTTIAHGWGNVLARYDQLNFSLFPQINLR